MEQSILTSTKKILGLAANYTAFDHDIITHINTALSTLTQLGIGPSTGFEITDDTAVWGDFLGTDLLLNPVKSYVYLKVRMMFDPPATSYLIGALEKQLEELEWRISVHREELGWIPPPEHIPDIIEGGTI